MLWIVVLTSVACSAAAHAYIPPSFHLVKAVASKRAAAKGFRWRSVVSGWDGSKPSGPRFRQVGYFDAKSRILRSRAFDEAGKEIYAVERKLDSELGFGRVALALLVDSSPESLARVLKEAAVPVVTEEDLVSVEDEEGKRRLESQFMGRWNRTQVAWVIGKPGKGPERGDDLQPQLWVEKDTFLPSRYLARDTEGNSIEARFGQFRFVREVPFPRTIELIRPDSKPAGGEVLVHEEVSEVLVISDASEFSRPLVSGYTEEGESADSAVRELIRITYMYLR